MRKEIHRCSRCVMDDSSDSTIRFDADGVCNYCTDAIEKGKLGYFPEKEGQRKLAQMIERLKEAGKGKPYDCLMGISGGLDSAYLAYLGAVKWGLRICAIHVDDGFDTELAKNNIRNLCEKCHIELKVITPDAEQFNDLTRAYFMAEVPNAAIPQDNILFACLYDYARKYKIYNSLQVQIMRLNVSYSTATPILLLTWSMLGIYTRNLEENRLTNCLSFLNGSVYGM